MKIGFTGTRHGMTDAQRANFGVLMTFDFPPTEFHHGSCQGSDVEAAIVIRHISQECVIICHPGPDNDEFRCDSGVDNHVLPGKTHFARNRDIVNACEVLIATPYEMERQKHGGTWYTIWFAAKQGKRTLVILPDGTITTYNNK